MDAFFILLIVSVSVTGPVIGSLLGVLKRPSETFMYNMLAFAAGVMISVSFLKLIPESMEFSPLWVAAAGIVLGSLVMYGLDRLIPHIHPQMCSQEQGCRLRRTATYLLLGIFLHNFPEGMAMGIGMVSGLKLSLIVALAIAIHNIPEGICTSAPYYFATKKRTRAFLLSASTAIPTVVGFIFAYFLYQAIPPEVVGMVISATAGVMIYISADELIPISCSREYNGWSHATIFSLIAGVILVMILGLI